MTIAGDITKNVTKRALRKVFKFPIVPSICLTAPDDSRICKKSKVIKIFPELIDFTLRIYVYYMPLDRMKEKTYDFYDGLSTYLEEDITYNDLNEYVRENVRLGMMTNIVVRSLLRFFFKSNDTVSDFDKRLIYMHSESMQIAARN